MDSQEENSAAVKKRRVQPDDIRLLVDSIWVWHSDDQGWSGYSEWNETGKSVHGWGCIKFNKQRQYWEAKIHKVFLSCTFKIWLKCRGLLDLWPHDIAAVVMHLLPHSNASTVRLCIYFWSFIWTVITYYNLNNK